MVKITNGKDVFEVTRGAYDGIYSRQGFVIVEEEKKTKEVAKDDSDQEPNDDELFIESIEEKPISQWKKNELKQYAALKGIDLSGTQNINEAKAIVKEFMESDNQEDEEV